MRIWQACATRACPTSSPASSDLDLALTLDILNRELGVKRLLLEGGGGANGAFLRAGLVDELSLVICPGRRRREGRAERLRTPAMPMPATPAPVES